MIEHFFDWACYNGIKDKTKFHYLTIYITSNRRDDFNDRESRRKRRSSFSLWAAIGAVVLIILLIVWLTIADLWGDTDVAQFALPLANML